MLALILTTFALFVVHLHAQPKIVGGHPAKIEYFPYQVFLEVRSFTDGWQCSASILDEYTLMTAAHCVTPPPRDSILTAYVRAGSTDKLRGGQRIVVATTHPHPLFDEDTIANDIAVLKLRTPLKFNAKVKPIQLGARVPPQGTMLSVAGWGTRSEWALTGTRYLYATQVPVVSRNDCLKIYKGFEIPVPKNAFCAGYLTPIDEDACQGDSGGAIVHKGKQIGIVSWGDGCGKSGKLGVYTDATKYRNFVKKYMY